MMKMMFFTPSNGIVGEFGAASFCFAGAENEKAIKNVVCPYDLNGAIIAGSYNECLKIFLKENGRLE